MTLEFILRIFVAAILGGLIGLEREYRAKEAGFRTHFLVALGAALFMIISAHGFADVLAGPGNIRLDPSRIAAQVVSGIGFIGAGTIIWRMGSGSDRTGLWSWYVYGRCFVNSVCAARIGSFQLLPPKVRPTQRRRIEIAASILNKV